MSLGSPIKEDVPCTEVNPESFGSALTIADHDTLRGSCFIPSEFQMVLVGPERRVHNPPVGGVKVYEEALKASLHFSLHPFVEKVLDSFILSMAQVAPNSWRYIIGFLSLCNLHRRRPTVSLFRAFFCLKRHPIGKGWWYFSQQRGYHLIRGTPSFIHRWKERFFYIHSEQPWVFDMI